jgi:hypothetical protein
MFVLRFMLQNSKEPSTNGDASARCILNDSFVSAVSGNDVYLENVFPIGSRVSSFITTSSVYERLTGTVQSKVGECLFILFDGEERPKMMKAGSCKIAEALKQIEVAPAGDEALVGSSACPPPEPEKNKDRSERRRRPSARHQRGRTSSGSGAQDGARKARGVAVQQHPDALSGQLPLGTSETPCPTFAVCQASHCRRVPLGVSVAVFHTQPSGRRAPRMLLKFNCIHHHPMPYQRRAPRACFFFLTVPHCLAVGWAAAPCPTLG